MELREYWRVISAGRMTIFFTVTIFALTVSLIGAFGYKGFVGSFNLYVIPQVDEASQEAGDGGKPQTISEQIDEFDIDLDQFYRLRAADLQARMVRQLLYDPAVLKDLYKYPSFAASTTTPATQPRLKIDQIGSQLLRVHFRVDRNNQVFPLTEAVTEQINTRLGVLQGRHDSFNSFRVKAFDIVVAPNNPDVVLNFSIAIIFGIVIGSFIVLVRHYWRTG